MVEDDILPPSFTTNATVQIEFHGQVMDMAPIILGYEYNVTTFKDLEIKVPGNRGEYVVPLSYPGKRYKVPCGLGSTLVVNNVVLMYPDVLQYLVNQNLSMRHFLNY